jgi:hypothetical protein
VGRWRLRSLVMLVVETLGVGALGDGKEKLDTDSIPQPEEEASCGATVGDEWDGRHVTRDTAAEI